MSPSPPISQLQFPLLLIYNLNPSINPQIELTTPRQAMTTLSLKSKQSQAQTFPLPHPSATTTTKMAAATMPTATANTPSQTTKKNKIA